jgi:SUMO ligase MMS21 Smc5/6 complex component
MFTTSVIKLDFNHNSNPFKKAIRQINKKNYLQTSSVCFCVFLIKNLTKTKKYATINYIFGKQIKHRENF